VIPGLEHTLVGRIDIIDGAEERLTVRDYKTAAKRPPAEKADRSLQLTAYALAARTTTGREPDAVGLDYAVRTKTKAEVVRLESTRDEGHYRALLEEMRRADALLRAGAFLPASDDAWWCSDRFCGYHDRCPWGAAGRAKPKEA
jgi:ATP-dependent helicase/DNAse subunit B